MRSFTGTTIRCVSAWGLLIAVGLLACGCSSTRPAIDPTGQRVLVTCPPGTQQPALWPMDSEEFQFRQMPSAGRQLILEPGIVVQPIHSELVLRAGVLETDGYLRTNERIEWSLDGVGQFQTVDPGSWTDLLVGDFTDARKVDNHFAVNSTSRRLLRVTQGTPDPADDVEILKGQAWVTVTSATEGVSHVTAVAPEIEVWPQRRRTTTVHWIDASWLWPTPPVCAAGEPRTLTTGVRKHSSGSPCPGWIVRYEIVGGPEATFANGQRVMEVVTNEMGDASVQIAQSSPVAGMNTVDIQIICPESAVSNACGSDADRPRFMAARHSVALAWSAAKLTVTASGPQTGTVGETLKYDFVVQNNGDLPSAEAELTVALPVGMNYESAQPPSMRSGSAHRWTLGPIAPGDQQIFQLQASSQEAGRNYLVQAIVSSAGEQIRSNAVATRIYATAGEIPERTTTTSEAGIDLLDWTAPTETDTGEKPVQIWIMPPPNDQPLEYEVGKSHDIPIVVTNNSQSELVSYQIRVTWEGFEFEYAGGQRVVTIPLPNMAPGTRSYESNIPLVATLKAVKPGTTVIKAELLDASGNQVDLDPMSVTVVESTTGAGVGPGVHDTGTGAPIANPIELTFNADIQNGTAVTVGQQVVVSAWIRNLSQAEQRNIFVVLQPGSEWAYVQATPGAKPGNQGTYYMQHASLAPNQTAPAFSLTLRANQATQPNTAAAINAMVYIREQARDRLVADASLAFPITASAQADGGDTSTSPLQIEIRDARGGYAPKTTVYRGTSTAYDVVISNPGPMPERNIEVEIALSPNITVSMLGTRGHAGLDYSVESRAGPSIVRFTPLAEMAPAQSATYRLTVAGREGTTSRPLMGTENDPSGQIVITAKNIYTGASVKKTLDVAVRERPQAR